MKTAILWIALVFSSWAPLFSQTESEVAREDRAVRLPNGKLQSEEILRAEHEKNLKDAGELMRLAEELKIDLEKNDRHVLSLPALKKTEEIEKLAKKIRERMRRF